MNTFENFLKENNYEDDLEFQLCDMKVAFDAGKKLQWKPSDEQIETLKWHINNTCEGSWQYAAAKELYNQLKELKGE